MLVQVKKIVSMSVMALAAAVITLPAASYAATSPVVAALSPLSNGLRAPLRAVLDAEGNLYVADQRVGGVVKLDAYGVQLKVIRTSGSPAGLAFAQDGTLLVSQSSFVARYNVVTGEEVGRLSGGQLMAPAGIAVDDVTGYIYVADSLANQVEMYTGSGVYVKSFAKGVRADASGATVVNPAGLVSMPTGIAFEKVSRQIAVADTLGNRIQFFDVNGNYVKSVGLPLSSTVGAAAGSMQFVSPVAITFEYSKGQVPALSRMYVVDSFQGNVQVVDPVTSGALVVSGASNNYIGSVGFANGQLMVPSDAVFDSANSRLLVVNGAGNVAVYGIDGGKNPVFVDVTPPVFTVNPVPAEVSASSLVIGGTVEAGATVQITSSGSVVAGVVTYNGTSWSAQLSGLAFGGNTVVVSAKDAAGNSAVAQNVNVNYLQPAPSMTLSPVASVTKSSLVTLTGAVDAGSVVVVSNQTTGANGNAVVSGAVWRYDVTLAEGINSVSVVAQNGQSLKTTIVQSIVLDTASPVLTVSALPNGSYTSSPVQNISGTVADQNATSVSVNGVAAVLSNNTFSVPVSLLNGSNVVSVVAADIAGNTTVDSRAIYYDAAGPVVTVVEPVDVSYTSSSSVKVSGSVDKAASVKVSGVAATVQGNDWNAFVNLVDGANTIEIVATDLYGNTSSVKRSVWFDAAKPEIAIVSPVQDAAVNVPNVAISGTVSDATALSLEYSVNGTVSSVPVNAGSYSFNVDFAAEGNYQVVLTAKDAAGNSSVATRNIIYDKTPPLFTLNQVNGVMPAKISGSVEPGSSVVVKDGVNQIGAVQIANGAWSADLTGVNYTPSALLAIATDAAGNSTSKSLSYNFPDGTLGSTGKPTVNDARRAIQIVVNQLNPSPDELAHYDIGPLVDGKPNPNGKIEIVDAILILRKALGLKSW